MSLSTFYHSWILWGGTVPYDLKNQLNITKPPDFLKLHHQTKGHVKQLHHLAAILTSPSFTRCSFLHVIFIKHVLLLNRKQKQLLKRWLPSNFCWCFGANHSTSPVTMEIDVMSPPLKERGLFTGYQLSPFNARLDCHTWLNHVKRIDAHIGSCRPQVFEGI